MPVWPSPLDFPRLRLFVGLGNPGEEYRGTRHNVGFMIMDRLSAQAGVPWKTERRWQAEITHIGEAIFCKPRTFMNLSGEAVRAVSSFYKIEVSRILVIYDEMALPLGQLRLRPGGSAGGHNGMKSVIAHFGTDAIPRLRMGIGQASSQDAVGHVLGRFSSEEKPKLEESLERGVAAIKHAQTHGLAAAMNAFN